MKHFRLIGMALLAVIAFSAVVASAASAEEAPFWTVGGTRLEAGQTRFITAKEAKSFKLSGAGVAVTCTATAVGSGAVILGSEPGEPGTNDETVTFSTCKVEGNPGKSEKVKGECETVTEPITTKNLKSTLVLDSTKTKLLVLFQPASGATLAELKFPKGCKIESTLVTGSVLAEALNEKEEPITTSSTATQYKTGFLRFPAAQPVEVWVVTAKTGKKLTVKTLEAFGTVAELSGTALVSLTSGEEWSALA
jgi:hypothetical protein